MGSIEDLMDDPLHLEWIGGAGPYTLRRAEDPQFSQGVQELVDRQSVTSYDDNVLDDGVNYYYEVH